MPPTGIVSETPHIEIPNPSATMYQTLIRSIVPENILNNIYPDMSLTFAVISILKLMSKSFPFYNYYII